MSYPATGETIEAHDRHHPLALASSRRTLWLAGLIIVLAGLVAYSDSLNGPFIFDDRDAIKENASITQGLDAALSPPLDGRTVTGRPLLNLSLALNYEWGGFSVQGYHAINLWIHLLAGLTLFGLVRRTLCGPVLNARFGSKATTLSLLIALLWTVHPLQTESVTYVDQRAEEMMGLFYLLTMYYFVRGAEFKPGRRWFVLSVLACLAGIFCKEVIVSAPLMVLLYDRTFVAGSFAVAWRQRWRWHTALACTWLPLAWLVARMSGPAELSWLSTTKGSGLAGLDPAMKFWAYGLKQCEAVVHYMRLACWPHPLVLDYGIEVVTHPLSVAPQMVVLGLLLAGTIYALWFRPATGFLGAWFFAILAPSSSIVPLTGETMAEHRMYLPLAALVIAAVLGLHLCLGRRAYGAGVALVLVFGGLTYERNRDYHTAPGIWTDTVAKVPDNPRPQKNLSLVLLEVDRPLDALPRFEAATLKKPNTADYYYDFGAVYEENDRIALACDSYLKALQLNPSFIEAHANLANLYLKTNRAADAIEHYSAVIRLKPDYGNAYLGLGNALLMTNQAGAAVAQYETALRLMPDSAGTHSNFGLALLQLRRYDDASRQFEETLRLDPNYPNARDHLDRARELAPPAVSSPNAPK